MPARIARTLRPGPMSEVNDQIVMTMIARETNAISVPIALKTAMSKPVSKLKWDATPRQVCRSMSVVSGTKRDRAIAQGHANHRVRGRRLITAARERVVIPPEMPNSIGLRQESGPAQPPSRTR